MKSEVVGLVAIVLGLLTLVVAAVELFIGCRKHFQNHPLKAGLMPRIVEVLYTVAALTMGGASGWVLANLTRYVWKLLTTVSTGISSANVPTSSNEHQSVLPLIILYAAVAIVFFSRYMSKRPRPY